MRIEDLKPGTTVLVDDGFRRKFRLLVEDTEATSSEKYVWIIGRKERMDGTFSRSRSKVTRRHWHVALADLTIVPSVIHRQVGDLKAGDVIRWGNCWAEVTRASVVPNPNWLVLSYRTRKDAGEFYAKVSSDYVVKGA